ncbi:DUF2177 family protein [Nocardioides mesophilus]|uniref:DUF2177 family protein n=1 Tax=Nocardioides mesophilus TaxID=433659 RepID=A0A7G9RFJ1_9ACTN|nr:DUF2177 family protein [Nocardioides mesophilus]QNN54366.1 DUF2177 family protein [Nocardioides mesophilus]
MQLRRALGQYVVAVVLFLVLDLIWLTAIASDLYDRLLGDLLAEQPNVLAAVAFYALFVAGLVHFVIAPAAARRSVGRAARDGAFFGLVTYATWDLTNLAVLDGFPASLVVIDLTWGAVLAAAVSAGTVALWPRVGARLGSAEGDGQ